MKQKILQDAKKQVEQYRGSPAWLQDAVPFDHAWSLPKEHHRVVSEILKVCGVPDRIENKINLEILCANLIKQSRKPIKVSLNVNDWKGSQYQRAGPNTIRLINRMNEEGLIGFKKGFKMTDQARITRIWATEKLLSYFKEIPKTVIYNPVNLVELRDETGNLKEYNDTAKTHRIKTILKAANNVNESADLRYRHHKLHAFLIAIFNRKFTLYGRLHTRGYRHYQSFSGEERQEFTINGDRTTELDFSGLHPHLLYAKEGIQFFGDPYSIVNENPIARPFLKIILLALLNAKDETAAERAGNYWLYKNHWERDQLKKIGITSARPIIQAFKEKHQPITHHFCTGKETGLKIMNLDATIALDIVKHFTSQKIPILAIHDSFIVQEQYGDELRKTMAQIYRKHTGFRIPITVEF